MAEPIDPDTLCSLPDIAKRLGYNADYLAQLAVEKRFRAWKIGKTWITTFEIVEAYSKTVQPAGRPKIKSTKNHGKNTPASHRSHPKT